MIFIACPPDRDLDGGRSGIVAGAAAAVLAAALIVVVPAAVADAPRQSALGGVERKGKG